MQEDIHILKDKLIQNRLKQTPRPPKLLYMRGIIDAPHHKYVTIVGSRKCSEYGKQVVEEICKSLTDQPITVISGLANGIDAYAHKCALKYNVSTIAVLGCGLSEQILRKHTNYKLAQQIINSDGALISEYPPEQISRPYMFPARNRIMVGLADLVIIIEAREKSGTLITARMATDYNRDLLVIPNSIYSHYSKGSNELIKQGAYVYTEPKDVFNLLKLDFEGNKTQTYTPTESEKIIIDAITQGINTTQNILDACSHLLTTPEMIQTLLSLEIEEVIKRVDGKYVVL